LPQHTGGGAGPIIYPDGKTPLESRRSEKRRASLKIEIGITTSDLSFQNLPQDVPVAMGFGFGAMAEQRQGGSLAQRLQQSECEFLAVILDG
jgi:hypothetical protein